MESLTNLVQSGDEAELLIAVDRLSAAREWENLETLAERCRDAYEMTGKQLWPIADHIDYRLALEAPADYAASVLAPGAGRFALGPLTEVAASVHPWAALEPHLDDPVVGAVVAAERTLRGEDLTADAPPGDLPHRLAAFEPTYALPRYRDRTAEFAGPAVATAPVGPLQIPRDPPPPFSDDAAAALTAVVEPWATQSNGTAAACAVEGSGPHAIGALTSGRGVTIRGAAISAAEGLALLQWAGASGGAHGRRRGGASGRFDAWWAAAAAAGLGWPDTAADFPAFTDELDAAMDELRWWRWEPSDASGGWELRVAIEDPVDGLAWAVEGTDAQLDVEEWAR